MIRGWVVSVGLAGLTMMACSSDDPSGDATIREIEPNDDGTPSQAGFFCRIEDFEATAVVNADRNGAFEDDVVVSAALEPEYDEDVFAIRNASNAPRAVSVEATGCVMDMWICIRDASGAVLASETRDNLGACSRLPAPDQPPFTLDVGGTAYVHIGGGRVEPSYRVAIDFE